MPPFPLPPAGHLSSIFRDFVKVLFRAESDRQQFGEHLLGICSRRPPLCMGAFFSILFNTSPRMVGFPTTQSWKSAALKSMRDALPHACVLTVGKIGQSWRNSVEAAPSRASGVGSLALVVRVSLSLSTPRWDVAPPPRAHPSGVARMHPGRRCARARCLCVARAQL